MHSVRLPMEVQMKLLSTILLVLFNALAMASGERLVVDADSPHDFKCEVIVEKDLVKFLFLDDANNYDDGVIWNDDPRSAMEHSWIVYFNENNVWNGITYGGFDIGVRYYSRDGEIQRGSLRELFSVSDIHGFAYGKSSFIPLYFYGESLSVNVTNRDVELHLRRSSSTSFFFENPPKDAHFWILSDKKHPRKCLTKIGDVEK